MERDRKTGADRFGKVVPWRAERLRCRKEVLALPREFSSWVGGRVFLRDISRMDVPQVNRDLDRAAIDLFASCPDKDWSLAYCFGFVRMERRKIAEALITDHHFSQAGFVRFPV